MTVRCGKCIGCRINRASEWAVRMTHESQMHPTNCTLTLTYAPEHLPENGTLVPDHHARFIHELRRKTGRKVRYFHCGEYGEGNLRPHYHTVLFGYDPADKLHWSRSKSGYPLYRSDFLNELWGKGHVHVGSLSFNSARYVAKYAIKEINCNRDSDPRTAKRYADRYCRVDPHTGEIVEVKPEYVTMSRRPGIGYTWFWKYKDDLYPKDFTVIDGKKLPVPRYYDRLLEEYFPQEYELVKKRRRENPDREHWKPHRLAAQEECMKAAANLGDRKQ